MARQLRDRHARQRRMRQSRRPAAHPRILRLGLHRPHRRQRRFGFRVHTAAHDQRRAGAEVSKQICSDRRIVQRAGRVPVDNDHVCDRLAVLHLCRANGRLQHRFRQLVTCGLVLRFNPLVVDVVFHHVIDADVAVIDARPQPQRDPPVRGHRLSLLRYDQYPQRPVVPQHRPASRLGKPLQPRPARHVASRLCPAGRLSQGQTQEAKPGDHYRFVLYVHVPEVTQRTPSTASEMMTNPD